MIEGIEQNNSLVAVSCELSGQKNSLRDQVKALEAFGELLSVSNVYKRASHLSVHGELWAAIKIQTQHGFRELSEKISLGQSERNCSATLLSFNDLVVLDPHLTLPAPSLWADKLLLRCAAEAWPTYFHPILKKNLGDLAGQAEMPTGVEFFTQGKVLI